MSADVAGGSVAGGDGDLPLSTATTYCGQCGEPQGDAPHPRCLARAELEPPRYCASCRRRMVVQVVPRGWTARCSEHGVISS